MDFFTHFLMGILLSIFTLNSFNFSIVLYGVIMAVLADFDIILEPLKRIKDTHLLSHKGISHSYFFALIVSGFTGIVFSLITQESFFLVWIVGFLFYSLHLTLDFLTASKIPLLYPLYKKRIRFFIDRAINIVLATVSGSIILFYFVIFFLWPSLYYSPIIYPILGFYVLYFTYRIITKVYVQLRLPKNARYIPGIFPFTYLIYYNHSSGDDLIFRLTKKLQFRNNNTILYEKKIKKASQEEDIYIRALEISRRYVFFLKWEYLIPLFKENAKTIILFLLLSESYFSGSFYSIKIQFDKLSNQIIGLEDGFSKNNLNHK
ncbi:MAG: metal-dependent hydrolase [Promethearchaeota archaeon]|nr:MAG: metal-dependent hydrolase [Candidatus Lokiarchaeota archaeon]